MDFRASCAVAAGCHDGALTHGITDGLDVQVITYIDNILLVGKSDAQLQKASTRFFERVKAVRAQLNPDWQIESSFDFLGERYDLASQTRTLTERTREKLRTVEQYVTTS